MKSKSGSGPLIFVIGFCAGIITTICLLVPGKIGPTVLLRGDEQLQRRQLDLAGQKVEQFGANVVNYITRGQQTQTAAASK